MRTITAKVVVTSEELELDGGKFIIEKSRLAKYTANLNAPAVDSSVLITITAHFFKDGATDPVERTLEIRLNRPEATQLSSAILEHHDTFDRLCQVREVAPGQVLSSDLFSGDGVSIQAQIAVKSIRAYQEALFVEGPFGRVRLEGKINDFFLGGLARVLQA